MKTDSSSNESPLTKSMKIVVIGGSGLIGTKLVNNLRRQGYEVVAASPSSGVNTLTGEGLAEALAGAQVVVDLANSLSFEDKAALEFFETSGRNLLAAEAAAGVGHHVALSVVGSERLQESGYFRAKMVQENLIKASRFSFFRDRNCSFRFCDKDLNLGFLVHPFGIDRKHAGVGLSLFERFKNDLTVAVFKPIRRSPEVARPCR
jgi:hypothetical protein